MPEKTYNQLYEKQMRLNQMQINEMDRWTDKTLRAHETVFFKVPSCNFVCICFDPVYGADQCYWSQEWVSAQRSMDNQCTSTVAVNYLDTSTRIEAWFRESSLATSTQTGLSVCGPVGHSVDFGMSNCCSIDQATYCLFVCLFVV